MTPQTFELSVSMETPAILQGHLTLESLLAASVFDRTGLMREEALAQVPLDSIEFGSDKIWMASSAFYRGAVRLDSTTIIRRRVRDEMGPEFYEPNPRARKTDPFAVEQGKGDYKALLTTYSTVEVSELVWLFQGNPDKCSEMIAGLMFLGKRRGQGFGQISSVNVREFNGNPIVDAKGMALRPIPVRLLPLVDGAAPADRQSVSYTVGKHPLFDNPPETHAVPKEKWFDCVSIPETAPTDEEEFFG